MQRHPNCAPDAAGLHHLPPTRGGPITLIGGRIGDADNPFARQNSSHRGIVAVRSDGATLSDPIAEPWIAVHRAKMKALTIPGSENAKGRLAQPRCLFKHCVEHRREVAGRGINDLQNLGSRGLLLQRLARLGDQPRVFHCNNRLSREIL